MQGVASRAKTGTPPRIVSVKSLMMSIRHESVTALRHLQSVIASSASKQNRLRAEVIFTEVRNCIWPTAAGLSA
jgi:hypothetical protein